MRNFESTLGGADKEVKTSLLQGAEEMLKQTTGISFA